MRIVDIIGLLLAIVVAGLVLVYLVRYLEKLFKNKPVKPVKIPAQARWYPALRYDGGDIVSGLSLEDRKGHQYDFQEVSRCAKNIDTSEYIKKVLGSQNEAIQRAYDLNAILIQQEELRK